MIDLYGIPNCDTVKKARNWCDANDVAYDFHDLKQGVGSDNLATWADAVGWEVLLNRRSTTWRNLDDADKADMTRDKALSLLEKHPTLIKRPVAKAATGAQVLVGFAKSEWENSFG